MIDPLLVHEMKFFLIRVQASRIILATDADPPGQALAEELARRLGRERFALLSLIMVL